MLINWEQESERRRKEDIAAFFQQREAVLAQWPTGKDVDLDEGVRYCRGLPDNKIVTKVLGKAIDRGDILLMPRHGVATVEENIAFLNHLRDEGAADILPSSVDAYTRNLQFEKAAAATQESYRTGRSLLDGVPIVDYGVQGCRRLSEATDVPWHARAAGMDNRLLYDIAFAAGGTGPSATPCHSGWIAYTTFSKKASWETLRAYKQYLSGLWGYYQDAGIEVSSPYDYNPNVAEPGLAVTQVVLGVLEARQRGTKSPLWGIGIQQQGNLTQDVASLRVLAELSKEYWQKFGFHEQFRYCLELHQWMGAFPLDEARAFGVICLGAATAVLAGCNLIVTKATQEGKGLATKESNAAALRATRQVVEVLRNQKYPDSPTLAEEMRMVKLEAKALIDAVIALGDGDVGLGRERAYEAGMLDDFCSTNEAVAGKALEVRDNQGALRWLDPGNMPIPKEVLEFHREKLAERAQAEQREISYEMVIDDCYSLAGGRRVQPVSEARTT